MKFHGLPTYAKAVTATLCVSFLALISIARANAASPVILILNDAKNAHVTVTPFRGNINALEGSGGNIVVLKSPHGLLLVDGGIELSKRAVLHALRSISTENPKYLIDTHYHFDHTDGNAWLHRLGATIVAQENTLKRLSTITRVDDWDWSFPPTTDDGLPTVLVSHAKVIPFSGTRVEIVYYGPSHTDTDLSVYFAQQDVLATGDTWWNGYYPFIDNENGGSIDGMIRAANENIAKVSEHSIVVPGHGPIGGRAELIRYRDMLVAIRNSVAALKAKGMNREQVIAAKPTADFDAAWGQFVINGDFFTKIVYDGL
jgi:glyoxylase-like metal-dependent hydrolase (beta-lactamase superfamily II)